MTAIAALIVAATLSSAPVPAASDGMPQASAGIFAAAIAQAPAIETTPERWTLDRRIGRPASIPVLYGTLGALQALDVYSTRRALRSGGSEVNPLMKEAAGNRGAMIAAKALSTAGAIYFTERAWKKNRKGAVVLMAVVNGVTAAVVARNLRNAR